jgi:hypothetical protein
MHIILRMFLIILAVTIVVDCQGGGGHRSSSSSRSGRSRFLFAEENLAKEEYFISIKSDSEDSSSIRYDPTGTISVRQNRIDSFSI